MKSQLWLRRAGLGLIIAIVGVGIGWAGAVVLTPPRDVLDSTAFSYVKVVKGEVGSSITLNTIAEWTPVPIGSNLATGTVTTINVNPGDSVAQGTVLYTVNLRPVVIASGSIPAFESLAQGSRGADVSQLQTMLKALGYFPGTVNGTFGRTTTLAVKAWQKSLGESADGAVQSGDIIFVENLPTRIALDPKLVKRGAVLAGGEAVVNGLGKEPSFSVPVTDSQSAMMPDGTRVEITNSEGAVWNGYVEGRKTDDQSAVTLTLAGKDGASICADSCGTIPATGTSLLLSRVVTVESVVGLTVPSAALLSDASGNLSVVDDKNKAHPVTVVTSARGMSIIKGVPAGLRVRIPAGGD